MWEVCLNHPLNYLFSNFFLEYLLCSSRPWGYHVKGSKQVQKPTVKGTRSSSMNPDHLMVKPEHITMMSQDQMLGLYCSFSICKEKQADQSSLPFCSTSHWKWTQLVIWVPWESHSAHTTSSTKDLVTTWKSEFSFMAGERRRNRYLRRHMN